MSKQQYGLGFQLGEETDEAEEKSIVTEDPDHAPAPSFLKRISSWITTPTDQFES